jgi:hypothetical protein
MNKTRVKITLLCEDTQHAVFVRYFLVERGFNKRDIYTVPLPVGQSGSKEQFVRETYLSEVRKYRQAINIKKNNQKENSKRMTSIALVVMTDADNLSVQQRINQLSSVLKENDLPDRQREEAIAVFIPKRNIETWIAHLRGENVNEEDNKTYNKLPKESDCKPQVEDLADRCQQQELLETNILPSLKIACQEFQRLLPLLNPGN